MSSSKTDFKIGVFKQICSRPIAIFSLTILIIYSFILLLAALGWIASDVSIVNNQNSYAPPSWDYWMGTDFFGRNVLSRAIHGGLTAFSVGLFSALIATFIGSLLGAIAGYYGGKIDDIVVWVYTTVDSIPYILLISAFAFALGQGLTNIFLALGLTGWVKLCRLIRGEFIKHRDKEYVQAAQALGASDSRKIFRHILPNVLHLALIQFSLSFVLAVKLEVILSYLGLGVEPGTPSWGMMIDDAKIELHQGVWWNLAAATLAMFFLVLAVNLFTETLREILDPKLRGKLNNPNKVLSRP